MKKDNFYKIIKILYQNIQLIDAESGQPVDVMNALHVYQLVEEVIPKLLKGYDPNKGWVASDTNKRQVKQLINSLKKIKTLPRPQSKDVNRKAFSELRQFLEFVESIQHKRTIKRKYSDITLIDEDSGLWTFEEEDHAEMFLKAYLAYRYQKQTEQHPHDQEEDAITQLWAIDQNDALEKLDLEVKADIALQLKKAGMLSVVAAKIIIRKSDQQSSPFTELISDKTDLLDVLGSDKNIVRIFYKQFLKTKETLAYYVVFFMQSVFHLNENLMISSIPKVLGEHFTKTFGVSVNIKVQSLNSILSENLIPAPQSRDFLLVEGVKESWEFIEQGLLEFLYQIEKLGELKAETFVDNSTYILSVIFRAIRLRTNTFSIEPLLIYVQANHVQEQTLNLLLLSMGQRSKYIWDIMHLSDHAKEYIARIVILYQENFAIWKIQKYLELAIRIEIFIMTLMESAPNAFYSFTVDVRSTLNRNIENYISRQLLQFTEIFRNQYQLNLMQLQLEGKMISYTLKYFFHIYIKQLSDQGDAAVVERILVADIKETYIQKKLDNLLSQFRLTQPLFFKAEPRLKSQKNLGEKKRIRLYAKIDQSSSSQSIIPPTYHSLNPISLVKEATQLYGGDKFLRTLGESGVETPHKLIHIQRHKSRLEKVQRMLKSAMKTDVVIIRCLFYCDVNQSIDYANFSKIFSTMLQDNKKRKPISDITAYLGYWEGRTRTNQKQITNYAANVVLIFKSQALLEYHDLFAELEHNWRSACRKIERECDPEVRIQGKVEKLQIAQTLSQLQCHQLLLETTQKTLARNIVNYLASYTVYQDLLDDEIYQQLPKWLIKKTATTNKSKVVGIVKRKKVQA